MVTQKTPVGRYPKKLRFRLLSIFHPSRLDVACRRRRRRRRRGRAARLPRRRRHTHTHTHTHTAHGDGTVPWKCYLIVTNVPLGIAVTVEVTKRKASHSGEGGKDHAD